MDGLIAYALSKKYADEVGRSILDAGFKTQIEQDRSILQTTGQEKILYFIPKTTTKPSDGYDEYVYSNNTWEQVGATDVDLSSYATKAEVGNLNNLPTTDKSSIVSAISETFTSVSNGKSLVASAITDKGISTSSDATFEIMAQNIEAIPEGIDMTVTDNQIKMLVYIHPAIRHCYVNFVQTVANDVEVDWGDGTAVDSSPSIGNDRSSCAVISHNYNSDGLRIITLTAKQGILHALDTSVGFIMFAGAPISTVDGDTFPNNYYRHAIVGISFGENTFGKVEYCSALLFIYGLKYVSGAYNSSLANLTLSTNITEMPLLMETNIRNIIIPNAIRTFRSNCLRNCTFLKIVDFTYYSISELSQCVFGSNMFTNTTNNGLIILFKDQETAEYAKTITNLSAWSRYIKYVGEV